jgi:hypothetical protein
MLETKAVIVYFIENTPLSLRFTKWTNHITIVPPFITRNIDLLNKQVASICERIPSFNYTIGDLDHFGPNRSITVNRIRKGPDLTKLHVALFNIAKLHDANISTQHVLNEYTPHITHNSLPLPQQHATGLLNKIYLVVYPDITKKDKVVDQIYNLR